MIDINAQPWDLFVSTEDDQLYQVEDSSCWPIMAIKNIETEFVTSGTVGHAAMLPYTPLKNVHPKKMAQIIIRLSETVPQLRADIVDVTRQLIAARQELAEAKKTMDESVSLLADANNDAMKGLCFIQHIRDHQPTVPDLMCPICNKTFAEITKRFVPLPVDQPQLSFFKSDERSGC